MTPEERILALGLTLPQPPAPVASYIPWTFVDNMIYVSGQLPMEDGKVAYTGKVGADVSLEEGVQAARLAALNAMAQLQAAVQKLENIERIVRLGVFVNSAPNFTDQSRVANGASDLLVEVFRDSGRHVRVAVGAAELPMNAAVEVELLAVKA